MIRRIFALVFALSLTLGAVPVVAQETVSDLREELLELDRLIDALRTDLSSTGGTNLTATEAGDALIRLQDIESDLRSLQDRINAVEDRIARAISDASNRFSDFEFRISDLEGMGTDHVESLPPLGGGGTTDTDATTHMASAEQESFDAAMAAFEEGRIEDATRMFSDFVTNFPGGPLTSSAQYWRGSSLAAGGDWGNAARAYLDSFSGDAQGPYAHKALFGLATSLYELQQDEQACLTLDEILIRYPVKAEEISGEIEMKKRVMNCE